VNALRHEVEHARDLAAEGPRGGAAARLLHDHGHGETLVQDAQLAVALFPKERKNKNKS
jgi:hypothetical protein